IIDEMYTARDNSTKINGNGLNIIVEVVGYYDGPIIVYPFGYEVGLPSYCDMTLDMYVKDKNYKQIKGLFRRNEHGIYIIQIDRIVDIELPFTLECNAVLSTV